MCYIQPMPEDPTTPAHSILRSGSRSQRADIDALSADGNSGVVVDNILAVLTDLVPVDNVPPVADVLGPAVLVLEVVRVNLHYPSAYLSSSILVDHGAGVE